MHDPVFHVVIVWQIALAVVLVVHAVRVRRVLHRVVVLDALALVVVASLASVAVDRAEAGYLDVALALALLGFGQTVATVRLCEQRGWSR